MKSLGIESNTRRRRLRRLLALTLIGVSVSTATGCTMWNGLQNQFRRSEVLDEFMINHRNKVMAKKAWLREAHCYKGHQNLSHYRDGFIAGYIDVANGGYGCTPAVAPSSYWGWRYQSSSGACAVNAWFEGFPMGVKAAEQDGIGNWSQVRTRGFNSHTRVVAKPMPQPNNQMLAVGDGESIVPGSVVHLDEDAASSKAGVPSESIVRGVQTPGPNPGASQFSFEMNDASSPDQAAPAPENIDSVIDDIFGKPAPSAEPNAPAAEASGGSLPFTFN